MFERQKSLKNARNIWDFSKVPKEFKKPYQPRSNLARDVKGVLLAVSHRTLNS
jgi:hypothetical protein